MPGRVCPHAWLLVSVGTPGWSVEGLTDLHPCIVGTKAAYLENVDVWDTQLAKSPSGGIFIPVRTDLGVKLLTA